MTNDLLLRRKWTLSAHGRRVIFIKKVNESAKHVLMKAFIWALYLPDYPDSQVEIRIGDRYKPDIVQLNLDSQPEFWGEAGDVGYRKIQSLCRRFKHTHFAMGKWDANLDPFEEMVRRSMKAHQRTQPFDLIRFAPDSAEKFIDERGNITITHDDVEWRRLFNEK